MTRIPLTPEECAELGALREGLSKAGLRAAEALGTVGDSRVLEGDALTRFEEADYEVAEIRRRV